MKPGEPQGCTGEPRGPRGWPWHHFGWSRGSPGLHFGCPRASPGLAFELLFDIIFDTFLITFLLKIRGVFFLSLFASIFGAFLTHVGNIFGIEIALKKPYVLEAFPGAILGATGHPPIFKNVDFHCTVVQNQRSSFSLPNASGVDF